MKKIKKFLFRALSLLCCSFCAFQLTACSFSNDGSTLSYPDWFSGSKGEKGDKGEKGEKGEQGEQGEQGVGIANAYVNENKHLMIVLTNGTVIDAGYVGVGEDTQPTQPISGSVLNSNGNTPIENATIEIYSDFTMTYLIKTVYSDATGKYEANLPVGTYYIKITANGFISFETVQVMNEGGTTYIESFIMVEGEDGTTQTGTVGGTIINSLTGYSVGNVQLIIRAGWNNTDGEIVSEVITNSDGSYELELPLGNYTVSIIKEGYVFNHINIVVSTTINLNIQGTINPEGNVEAPSGDLRIVLTWGETPADLDSHLVSKDSSGTEKFHVYYDDKQYAVDNAVIALLDLDDIESYGPETTTIYSMDSNGTYSYYVHNFSDRKSTSSSTLASSGAKIQVYIGDTLIATYNVPTAQDGTLWHVFDYDASTGKIIPVNEITYHATPSTIG